MVMMKMMMTAVMERVKVMLYFRLFSQQDVTVSLFPVDEGVEDEGEEEEDADEEVEEDVGLDAIYKDNLDVS
jgi:hypothetical protein